MKKLEITSEQEFYGVKIYTVRNSISLMRHSYVFVDIESIAEKTGMSGLEILRTSEYDAGTREAVSVLSSPDGGKKIKAIRINKVNSLFKLLHIRTNGEDDMVKTGKAIVMAALETAPLEEKIHD